MKISQCIIFILLIHSTQNVSLRRRKSLGINQDFTHDHNFPIDLSEKQPFSDFEPYTISGNRFGKVYSRKRKASINPTEEIIPIHADEGRETERIARSKKPRKAKIPKDKGPSMPKNKSKRKTQREKQNDDGRGTIMTSNGSVTELGSLTNPPTFPTGMTKKKLNSLSTEERREYFRQYRKAYYFKSKQRLINGTPSEKEMANRYFQTLYKNKSNSRKRLKEKVRNNTATEDERKRLNQYLDKQSKSAKERRLKDKSKIQERERNYRKNHLEAYRRYNKSYKARKKLKNEAKQQSRHEDITEI